MTLNQSIQTITLKIKFAFKRLKLITKVKFYAFIISLLPSRTHNFDLTAVKKILIIRNDRIGDMVITTAMIRNLAQAGYEVYVSSRQNSLEIIRYNPHVKGVYCYNDNNLKTFWQSVKTIRKTTFDLAIDAKYTHFFELKQTLFSAFVKSKILAGFNRSNIKAFNLSIPYHYPKQHVTYQLMCLLNAINVKYNDMHYELYVDSTITQHVQSLMDKIRSQYQHVVIINPFGSTKQRQLSYQQIVSVCELFTQQTQIIIIGEQHKIEPLKLNKSVIKYQSSSILDIIPLVALADIVISVDTAVVHIASCYQINTLAFYLNTELNHTASKASQYFEQFLHFKIRLLDHLNDAPYLKQHQPDRALPINHEVWQPNNCYAQQITVMHYALADIPVAQLQNMTADWLHKSKMPVQVDYLAAIATNNAEKISN